MSTSTTPTTNFHPTHPQELYTPGWHSEAETPIIDNKYHDPRTGALLVASPDHEEYSGPPAVDMIVTSIHADTADCVLRAARPFPVEVVLCQTVKVIKDRALKIDSLVVTKYAVRVVLACELSKDEFMDVAVAMTNGVWDEKE